MLTAPAPSLSWVPLSVTQSTAAHQAPLSVESSGQNSGGVSHFLLHLLTANPEETGTFFQIRMSSFVTSPSSVYTDNRKMFHLPHKCSQKGPPNRPSLNPTSSPSPPSCPTSSTHTRHTAPPKDFFACPRSRTLLPPPSVSAALVSTCPRRLTLSAGIPRAEPLHFSPLAARPARFPRWPPKRRTSIFSVTSVMLVRTSGCAGSWWLHRLLLWLRPARSALPLRDEGVSLRCLLLLCSVGSRKLRPQELRLPGSGAQAQELWLTGLAGPRHVGSSQTRARTRVSCNGRQILYP